MDYAIEYYSEEVEEQILALPDTLAARYVVLTRRMAAVGANLGPPHTESFGQALFELRLNRLLKNLDIFPTIAVLVRARNGDARQ